MASPGSAAAQPTGAPGPVPTYAPARHALARAVVAATLVLIFAGGLVTSMGAGLSVPDWPLSYGMLMPPMVGNVRIEHGHRMIASGVGFLTLALALWTARAEDRRGVRVLAWSALGAVVAQGLLGGLTVVLLLPPAVSVAHALLAQTFFCIAIALSYAMSREWLEAARPVEDTTGVRPAALAAAALVYLQLLLGALMRHLDRALPDRAPLAIPDFPLSLGRVVPPFTSLAVAVHFAHRVNALVVLAAVVWLWVRCRSGPSRLRGTAHLALALVLLQITLGATTVLSGKAVFFTTLHVATGAAVLGACWLAVLRGFRLLRPHAPVPIAIARLEERPTSA